MRNRWPASCSSAFCCLVNLSPFALPATGFLRTGRPAESNSQMTDPQKSTTQHGQAGEPSSHPAPQTIDVVLVNPAAGGGVARDVLPSLRKLAREQKWHVEFVVTEGPDDLAARARQAVDHGHRRLFVLGGDGTFQILVNAVSDRREQVVLGIIPAGGGNDLAAALGLPTDPLRAASVLLAHSETCRLDVVRVRTADGHERLYTGGGGVGLDAEAARFASGIYRNLRGRFRYVLSAIRALLGFRSFRVSIAIDARASSEVHSRALLVAVLNTPSYGAGIYLAPDASTTDGQLDLVVLEPLSVFEILAVLPSLWSKGKLNTTHIQRSRVNSVRIETERPSHFHGDGEILGLTPVEVSVIPQALCILRASEADKS